MYEFIEVTENVKKTLISTSDISKIIRAKKGYAVIYLKLRYRPWFLPYESVVLSDEPYETIRAMLSADILRESNEATK